MKHLLALVLFLSCFAVGCDDKKPAPSVPTINYGCRVSAKSWLHGKKGANPRLSPSYASSESEAQADAERKYRVDVPDADDIQSNCWDCSRTDLDKTARKICTQ